VDGEGQSSEESPREIECEYYTPKEVATILNLSMDMVYDLLREGQLPAIRLGTGKRQMWRIPKAGFEEYVERASTTQPYDEERRAELRAKLKSLERRREEDETSES
jgi:excisionase family DNA binding protein